MVFDRHNSKTVDTDDAEKAVIGDPSKTDMVAELDAPTVLTVPAHFPEGLIEFLDVYVKEIVDCKVEASQALQQAEFNKKIEDMEKELHEIKTSLRMSMESVKKVEEEYFAATEEYK